MIKPRTFSLKEKEDFPWNSRKSRSSTSGGSGIREPTPKTYKEKYKELQPEKVRRYR